MQIVLGEESAVIPALFRNDAPRGEGRVGETGGRRLRKCSVSGRPHSCSFPLHGGEPRGTTLCDGELPRHRCTGLVKREQAVSWEDQANTLSRMLEAVT